MGIIILIAHTWGGVCECVCVCVCVHTWGVVDKSQAVCPQKEALHSPHVFGAAVHTIGFLVLGTYYFTIVLVNDKCFSVIEINAIFVQLCGLSQNYVATHEPGRNII